MLLFGIEEVLIKCRDKIFESIVKLDKMLNKFDVGSEVYTVNSKAFHYPVKVSKDLCSILTEAVDFHKKTDGLFDITVSDISALELDSSTQSISFKSEDLSIDFGGFGKGLALREVNTILDSYGVSSALVNFGNSSILAKGKHPHGEYWPIGVDDPRKKGEIIDTLKARDISISISGNSIKKVHIYNPISKTYIDANQITVVMAEDPLVAEVLSTVLMIADIEQGNRICEDFNVFKTKIYSI